MVGNFGQPTGPPIIERLTRRHDIHIAALRIERFALKDIVERHGNELHDPARGTGKSAEIAKDAVVTARELAHGLAGAGILQTDSHGPFRLQPTEKLYQDTKKVRAKSFASGESDC